MSIYDKSSLVLIPSGTKTGKVYSQKPVSGDGDFTFTRSSAATRVNADGNIEKETQNLILQSNQFDTSWDKYRTSLTSGQSGYDGTNNAWLLTATDTFSARVQQTESLTGVQVLSVYAKAGTANFIVSEKAGTNGFYAWFDLSNGTIGNTSGDIDTTIEDVGNGWYRCSISGNPSSGTKSQFYVAETNGSTTISVGASIYIQDAQLNQGLIAQEVITTTTTAVEGGITDNVPRLDYTDSSCPALLLEPQRTNLITQSEYFNGADWINVNVTATENAATSPEGVQNATQLDFTGTSFKRFEQNTSNAATACTTSIFMKYIDHAIVLARMDSTSGSSYAWFNIQTGEVLKVDGANGSVPDPIASVDDYGNGWYRLNTTQTAMAGSQEIFWYFVPDTDTSTGSWTGSGSAYAYGAQFEQGSYATSYIPTYGSSVSRVADNMDTTFSSPIPTTGNVSYFIHLDGSDRSGNATAPHATIRFAGNDYITYNASGGGYHRFRVNVDGTANYYTGNLLKSQEAKLLAVINGNYIKIFMNGQQVNQGTLLGTPNMISATGYTGSTSQSLGPLPIKELLLISTALTDQEAIDLTTI